MGYLDLAQQARARQQAHEQAGPRPSSAMPPDELNELTKKPPLPAAPTTMLRLVYRAQFRLAVDIVDGGKVDHDAVSNLRQQLVRLTDEVGPLWADALFADESRRFRADTGRCGVCGGLGHEAFREV